MKLVQRPHNTYTIFEITGRLDSTTSPNFEKPILEAIRNGPFHIILDFKHLDYISSAGLRVILNAAKELDRKNGKIVICRMEDYIKEVFEISGFDTFLTIVPTLEDALKDR